MAGRGFKLWSPLSFFEKAGAPAGERRRIAGIISTELPDKQDEVVLQQGLDFRPFLRGGWFNDNHRQDTTAILGYPKAVQRFRKGEKLPDGSTASCNGTWAEGHLLDTQDAQKVWELGKALAETDRRLGFSIEGKVVARAGPDGKTVAKAVVRNVAVTNCPVGEETRMEVLAKSLTAAAAKFCDACDRPEQQCVCGPGDAAVAPVPGGQMPAGNPTKKALSMGAAQPGVSPAARGPVTGGGTGAVVARQSLEEEPRNNAGPPVAGEGDRAFKTDEEDAEKKKRPLAKSMLVAAIQNRLGCGRETAERAYGALLHLKQQGLL